jgi:hypothetical protein
MGRCASPAAWSGRPILCKVQPRPAPRGSPTQPSAIPCLSPSRSRRGRSVQSSGSGPTASCFGVRRGLQGQHQFRFYTGSEDQLVDPLIASIEGLDNTPAYRGLALAVFENLELADYGNRIPFLTFEVVADEAPPAIATILSDASRGQSSAMRRSR